MITHQFTPPRSILTIGPRSGPPPTCQPEPYTVISVDAATLPAIGDARALVEAELTELVDDDVVDNVGIVVGELAIGAYQAGLTPLHITAHRNRGHVHVMIRSRRRPRRVGRLLDQLLPDDGETWGLALIRELTTGYGIDMDEDSACLWCTIPCL